MQPLPDVNPIALALMQYKLPNGQFMIPNDDGNTPTINFPENAIVPAAAYFIADQAVSNLDYIVSSKDTLALKYYYQHDPTIRAVCLLERRRALRSIWMPAARWPPSPTLRLLTPNLSVAEVFGFIREKIYSTIEQPFTPQQFGINTFGSTRLPGHFASSISWAIARRTT